MKNTEVLYNILIQFPIYHMIEVKKSGPKLIQKEDMEEDIRLIVKWNWRLW